MVEPSKWPVVGVLGAFITAIGAVWYMQGGANWVLLAGLAVRFYCMYGWWREVVHEANSGADHTEVVRHGLRMGMVLFIARIAFVAS